MKIAVNTLLPIGLISILLTVVFIVVGDREASDLAAVVFLLVGCRCFDIFKKKINVFLLFILIIALLFAAIFIYYTYQLSTDNKIIFPVVIGFIYLFIKPVLFFFVGLIISLIKKKHLKLLFFYSIEGLLISIFFNRFSHAFSGTITALIYSLFAFHLFSKKEIKPFFIFLGLLFPFFILHILFSDLIPLAIVNTFVMFLGIIITLLLSKFQIILETKKPLLLSLSIISLAFYYLFLLNFSSYLYYKDCKLPENKIFSETFVDINGRKIYSKDFKDKIVVLDFWTTGCGVCFKKFPEFEKFYKKNKNDMIIYAVALSNKNQELSQIINAIKKMNYEFPKLIAVNDYNYFKSSYNINGVPTIIILDKKGRVVYNNNLNTNPLIIVNNLQNLVDELSDN